MTPNSEIVPANGKEALAAAKRLRGRDLDLLDLALSTLDGRQFDAARDQVRKRIEKRSKSKQPGYSVAAARKRSRRGGLSR